MKVKAIFLVAAGLQVLANATNNLAVSPSQQPDVIAAPGPATSELQEMGKLNTNCDESCHKPWVACVNECGGGSWCEYKCNCDLFNDRDGLCRASGCVGNIDNCPAKLKSPLEDVQADSVEKTDDLSLADGSPLKVPVPCIICRSSIEICKKKCATPGPACENSCNCYWKRVSPSCRECDVRCLTIHQCRDLNDEDMIRGGNIPIEYLDDPNAVLPDSPDAEDMVRKSNIPIEYLDDPNAKLPDSADAEKAGGHVDTGIVAVRARINALSNAAARIIAIAFNRPQTEVFSSREFVAGEFLHEGACRERLIVVKEC